MSSELYRARSPLVGLERRSLNMWSGMHRQGLTKVRPRAARSYCPTWPYQVPCAARRTLAGWSLIFCPCGINDHQTDACASEFALSRWLRMWPLARSIVASVMLAPARNLATNFPSLTAMRPKVVSAIFLVRRNSSISERSCVWVSISRMIMGYVPLCQQDYGMRPFYCAPARYAILSRGK